MGLEPTLKVLQTHTLTIMLPASLTISNQKNKIMNNTEQKGNYTFQLSDKVTREKVTFTN